MALAKKCDRCGKLYEHYPMVNKTEWNAIRKIQRNPVGDTVNSAYTPAIDLCPECMNEFEKFMSVKFQEDKNDEN